MLLAQPREILIDIIAYLPIGSLFRLARTSTQMRKLIASSITYIYSEICVIVPLRIILKYFPLVNRTYKILIDCNPRSYSFWSKDPSRIESILANVNNKSDLTFLHITFKDISKIARLKQGIFRLFKSRDRDSLRNLIIDHNHKLVCYNKNMRESFMMNSCTAEDPLRELLVEYKSWPDNYRHIFEKNDLVQKGDYVMSCLIKDGKSSVVLDPFDRKIWPRLISKLYQANLSEADFKIMEKLYHEHNSISLRLLEDIAKLNYKNFLLDRNNITMMTIVQLRPFPEEDLVKSLENIHITK